MAKDFGKMSPVRLTPDEYRILHREILQRDGWRCQICGTLRNLQVHHAQFRSRLGADVEDNLITLCVHCHAQVHSSAT